MLRDLRYPSLALALSLAVGHAHAQVIIDDILPVTVGVGNQGSTGLPVVANYDASGSDKLVVVYGTEHAFGINAGMVINSIEYNGTPMIQAVQENTLPGATAIFYLDNPGPPARSGSSRATRTAAAPPSTRSPTSRRASKRSASRLDPRWT